MIHEVTQAVYTYPVNVSYPESRPINARLEFAAGRLYINPGAESFINGQVVSSLEEWTPQVKVAGGTVTIRQGDKHAYEFKFKHLKHMKNEWTLAFGNGQPFGLHIECGAGQATLALGGLPLTGLQLD